MLHKLVMPPINQKKLKGYNAERKQHNKKRKEEKLLKAAAEFLSPEDGLEEKMNTTTNQDTINENVARVGPTFTISIAVPGSILDKAQSAELRTYLAGQIARAACIYCVDEIIVFDDIGSQNNNGVIPPGGDSCGQLARILQYLECPQYLRKLIFPPHKDLQYAGLLNPLAAPHHLLASDDFPFREGVVSHHQVKQNRGSYVNVGLLRDVCVDKVLMPGIRVTVRMLPQNEHSKKKHREGVLVAPSQPRQELGVYWGYTVRLASSLSDVIAKAPYPEGYDLTIGTSDKGTPISDCDDNDFADVKHVLIVFGGVEGLEVALENDENLNINDVSLLFDKYVNTCPGQGSRTIRTEEAILISLAQLKEKISSMNCPNER